ncbi:hypothetical protein D9611_008065 [Ephemerocybe angulata]|uniref:ATP-dependent DNA helicase n=1 Tax=Ephemerocybe angulata TaxID=980116 RepID=A0A8H5BZ88_9AGAR|nr:hypothetical protein D9611_008065 [Tulosesus angulatus]
MAKESDLVRVEACDIDLKLLRNDLLPSHLLPDTYDINEYDGALLEPDGMENIHRKAGLSMCKPCKADLAKGKMPKFALCNWLYYARNRLPTEVAKGFTDMSVFEKALICRVRTNSLLCRFSLEGVEKDPFNDSFVQRRRHIRGNVISTPLDVARISSILPPPASEIRDTICALIISSSVPSDATLETLKPIMVRKSRVKMLIEFLVDNNPHYTKCEGFKGFSSEYLDGLFKGIKDKGFPSAATIGHIPINRALDSLTEDHTGRMDEIEGLVMENVAYTSGDHSPQSYREMVLDAVERCTDARPFLFSRAGSQAVPDINNPAWLSWAHPSADPFGIGGFNDPRRKRVIGMEQQLKHLLTAKDTFFERDPQLAFDLYNIIRKAAVNTSIRFAVPYHLYSKTVDRLAGVDKDQVAALRHKYQLNPTYKPSTPKEIEICRVLSSIAPLAKKVPGTVSQKIKMRNEIRAVIGQKGSPTLFVTINPSDYHNPIVSIIAKRPTTVAAIEDLRALTTTERGHLAVDHPVACAQFFDAMMKAFISILLRHGRKGKQPGIFGQCEAYYGTVETQGRGTLHCHMLIWLKNHLSPELLADALKSSSEYGNALKTWIDSIMYSGFVGTRSFENSQPCNDSEGIRPPRDPHPASMKEPIASELSQSEFKREMYDQVDELLTRFNWHRHNGSCWKYLQPGEARVPENCRFGMDGTTVDKTEISQEEGTLSIKRTHPKMTHYNPIITFLMKCNTDIKYIGSGADAKAFMYYVTDYITKPPLSMHAGLTALAYAIRQGEERNVLQTKPTGDSDPRKAITIAINSMLGRQELSHPQVMSYILGGGENYTSERFQSINWAEVLRYVTGTRSVEAPLDIGAVEQPMALDDLQVAMTAERNTLTASSSLLDYIFRPTHEPYDSMGLYFHVATTRRITRKARDPKQTGVFSSPSHPQYKTHALGARRIHVIPVLLGPAIQRRKGTELEQETWARDICILFAPWRAPSDIEPGQSTWIAQAEALMTRLSPEALKIVENMSVVAEGRQARDNRPRGKRRGLSEQALLAMEMLPDLDTDEPALDLNVYAAAVNSSSEDEPHTDSRLARYLDDLLGPGSSWAIQQCFPAGPNPSSEVQRNLETRPGSPMDTTAGDSDMLDHQKRYMAKAKGRKRCREGEKDKPNKRRKRSQQQPAVTEISTVSGDPEAVGTRPGLPTHQQKAAAQTLAASRGLLDNPEQYRAYSIITHHAISNGPQLLMYIGGEGGTGKSYLIDSIIAFFKLLNRESEVRVGAFTGIAATLIGGNTLHSLLSMATNNKNPSSLVKRLATEWRGVKYLFIDEVSMISAQFLASISSKLQLARSDYPSACLSNFGGINVIFLGDFFQLAPPKQSPVYAYKLVRNPSFVETRSSVGIDAISGAYLWRQVKQVTILKQTKRHEGDKLLSEILSLIRSRRCIDNTGHQAKVGGLTIVEHIRNRDFEHVARTDPGALLAFEDAPVIVGNRMIRDVLNTTALTAHATRTSSQVHLYYSSDKIRNEDVNQKTALLLWSLPSISTKDAFGQLPMFVGMKVMVTENISIKFKVVNGSEGTITDIQYSEVEDRRYATVVYVKISSSSCIHAPGLEAGIVPIFPTASTIKYPTRFRNNVSKSFSRRQVPLIPAYSYTDYKSQGRTLKHAIVDLASAKQQGVYVMLSRVTTLKGLLILRWFPESKILQEMTGELRDEIQRLDALDSICHKEFSKTNVPTALHGAASPGHHGAQPAGDS